MSSTSLPPVPTTVLVSNSASLAGSQLGPTIDAFDCVVRFNDWDKTRPGDLGERVHLHACNDLTVRYHQLPTKLLLFNPWDRVCDLDHHVDRLNPRQCEIIPRGLTVYLMQLLGIDRDKRPSTGLGVIVHLLLTRGRLALAGFDSFATPRLLRHSDHAASFHNWDIERDFIQRLTAAGHLTHLPLGAAT